MSDHHPMPTFRPRRLLLWAGVMSLVVIVAALAGWFALAADVRADFSVGQVATLGLFVLVLVMVMMSPALSHVRATDSGLDVRNAFSRRLHPWGAIVSIRFRQGDPWAYLVLSTEGTGRDPDDPERRPMLGIQASDGRRASAMVERVRSEVQTRRAGSAARR